MEYLYIGDGVYVKILNDTLVLVASNGVEVTEQIIFDKVIWGNLLLALRELGWPEKGKE